MLLHAELSENQKVSSANTEPSFLWAGESRRQEVTQNDPQPPAAKRHKPNFNSSVFGTSSYSFAVSFEEHDVDTIIVSQDKELSPRVLFLEREMSVLLL